MQKKKKKMHLTQIKDVNFKRREKYRTKKQIN